VWIILAILTGAYLIAFPDKKKKKKKKDKNADLNLP
jgi:hypothetical protein